MGDCYTCATWAQQRVLKGHSDAIRQITEKKRDSRKVTREKCFDIEWRYVDSCRKNTRQNIYRRRYERAHILRVSRSASTAATTLKQWHIAQCRYRHAPMLCFATLHERAMCCIAPMQGGACLIAYDRQEKNETSEAAMATKRNRIINWIKHVTFDRSNE